MAADLYPYSERQDGAVSNLEHEALWSPHADGILPGEPPGSFSVSLATGGGWVMASGRMLIAGHVLTLDGLTSGSITGGQPQTRVDVLVAFIDRTTVPWTYGVRLHAGSPGGGRPSLSQSPTAVYEVPIRAISTAPNGANTLLADERSWLVKTGLAMTYADLSIPSSLYNYVTRGPARAYRYSVGGMTFVTTNGAVRRDDSAPWSAAQRGGGVMATLPVGYRPTHNVALPTNASSSFARLEVEPNGQMKLFTLDAGSSWVSLAGTFPIL